MPSTRELLKVISPTSRDLGQGVGALPRVHPVGQAEYAKVPRGQYRPGRHVNSWRTGLGELSCAAATPQPSSAPYKMKSAVVPKDGVVAFHVLQIQ